MFKTARIAALLAMAAGAAGCLQKETRHTLYLSPDGAVRWSIEESTVRSAEDDYGERIAEEQGFVAAVLGGAHGSAQALASLGPDGPVRTSLLRDERPYHIVTDARFPRVDVMLERLFRESGVAAGSGLAREDGRTVLRLRLDFTQRIQERDTPARALLVEGLGDFRFVLTSGRFVPGAGIEVIDDATARIAAEWITHLEAAVEARSVHDLVVAWEVDR
jgi:hypothetical protein